MKKQTNGKSNAQRVIDALEKKGTLKLAEIRASLPDVKSNYISTALWNLKKIGVVNHDLDSGEYKLTGVNKPVEVAQAPKVVTKITTNDKLLHIAQRDAKYWQEMAESRTELATKLNVQYEDALAVIRYLENKLVKGIQLNTRNGRNS
jgi:hypothetical protein